MVKMNDEDFASNDLSHDCKTIIGKCWNLIPGQYSNPAWWHSIIQRTFYNGLKSIDDMYDQTVDNTFEMTEEICGPTSLRRILRVSKVNDAFTSFQEGNDIVDIVCKE